MGEMVLNWVLLIVGALVLVYGVLVGIMKQTHLLKGFNEARVENKARLAKIVGFPLIMIGLIFVNAAMLQVKDMVPLISGLVAVIVALIVYVNMSLVIRQK